VLGAVFFFDPGQAKVADLEHTVGVYKEVPRFNVPVYDFSRVQVLDTSEDLIQKHLDMILGQVLRRYNDFMQIGLHELCDHIDLLKEVDVRRLKDIQAREDVIVFKETHHLELTKDAFGANQALEDVGQFLKCHTFPISWVRDGPDDSKSSISNRTIW
jgi:hypothetical protein